MYRVEFVTNDGIGVKSLLLDMSEDEIIEFRDIVLMGRFHFSYNFPIDCSQKFYDGVRLSYLWNLVHMLFPYYSVGDVNNVLRMSYGLRLVDRRVRDLVKEYSYLVTT